jgi:Icc-related predicted phosphoesterase
LRILAFSDLHRDQAAARLIVTASPKADIVVGAGDFGAKGQGIVDVIEILEEITIPTILVSGNHDNLNELRAASRNWKSFIVLHGESTTIDEVTFFGLGMEVPQRSSYPWNSYMNEEDAERALSMCPKGGVLVTHSPPYGGTCDIQRDGRHEGSKAIEATIKTRQPQLCLCGHIHHSWGAEDTIGQCRVTNLGPTVNLFEISAGV